MIPDCKKCSNTLLYQGADRHREYYYCEQCDENVIVDIYGDNEQHHTDPQPDAPYIP